MNSPTYNDAIAWCTEWIKENHPEMRPAVSLSSINWGDDFEEYQVYLGGFEEVRFKCKSIEILEYRVFDLIIPPTKDEFFTVLRILDK